MSTVQTALDRLGIELPAPIAPVAGYDPMVHRGGVAYVSGHGPLSAQAEPLIVGTVGVDVDRETARDAARLAALNCLSTLQAGLGSLERITGFCKVQAYILAVRGNEDHPWIGDGASELLRGIFGPDIGAHARTTMGVQSNPLNVTVSLDMSCTFE